MAKAVIARATGLSAQTVSNIMRSLEHDGLIVKGEPQRGKVGQPSVPIGLAPEGAYFLGLKVGRRSLEMVLTNFLGDVIARRNQTHLYPTPDATVAFVRDTTDALLADLPSAARDRIAGLGIAMPFQIWRWAREVNVAPEKMAGWKTFDIVAATAEVTGLPVFLENDASSACGAELVFGTTPRPADFLYIYIGYFIGGGVVLDNSLYTGPTGNAGAIGPLPVRGEDGRMVQLLDVASLFLLENALKAIGRDAQDIWHAAEGWDVPADILDSWIDTTAAALAQAIPAALSVIDFESVLIDGWMPTDVRARLVEATRRHMESANMTGLNTPALLEGSIGSDARALGAASLPLSQRFLLDTHLTH